MAIIGAPKSWDVTPRTTLDESRSDSKNVRRYGAQGSKIDATYKSTGGHAVQESAIAPSLPARHVGHIGLLRSEVVGFAPDGSGKWLKPTHDRELIGNAIETHPPLRPEGLAWNASGGEHGKPSKVPATKNEVYRTRMDAGALAGDGSERTQYTGVGPGKIR
jgi:hypothetical protein